MDTIKSGSRHQVQALFELAGNLNDDDRQVHLLIVPLTGNAAGVAKRFNRCGWQTEP